MAKMLTMKVPDRVYAGLEKAADEWEQDVQTFLRMHLINAGSPGGGSAHAGHAASCQAGSTRLAAL